MRCGLPQQRSKFLFKSINQTCNFLYRPVFVKEKRRILSIELIVIIEKIGLIKLIELIRLIQLILR